MRIRFAVLSGVGLLATGFVLAAAASAPQKPPAPSMVVFKAPT
jgi:hypothetical protein